MQKPLSRLEKFIYALCSLDSSELPNPLSRLEVLLNCLVTGETPPAFEPLSRNEKYLMAISGSYHDELPNPISRGEKLLYKLATGDDSIDDIGEALSRYEELLVYIVENGRLDGPIDVEYVTYILMSGQNTLYNTAKKPVKSAILTGQTLVNLAESTYDTISINADGYRQILKVPYSYNLKTNTRYYVMFQVCNLVTDGKAMLSYSVSDGELKDGSIENVNNGCYDFIITTQEKLKDYLISFAIYFDQMINSEASCDITNIMVIEYQEGMENWDIPYFEGIGSVKMPVLKTTGKNLFNEGQTPEQLSWGDNIRKVNVKENTTYVYSSSPYTGYVTVRFYDDNGNETRQGWGIKSGETFTTPLNTSYIKTHTDANSLVQIEEGSVATEYEPYKSTTVSCNEEVELRGIGEVKDELNLLTGEVAQNIGEVVLNGSESWYEYASGELTNTRLFYCGVPTDINISKFTVINNRFASLNPNSGGLWDTDVVGLGYGVVNKAFRLRVLKSTANTINELKEYLNSNPIVVQYELAEKSIKTVDLSVVNQDGNEAELSSFEDITHVTVTSEGILPYVELEVATKNEEVLNTMSLRMDDISTTQANLNKTVNTQSENVDATMIATTEIYEGLL